MKRLSNCYIYLLIAFPTILVFLGLLYPSMVEADVYGAPPQPIASDDFNSFNLDTGLWEFVDPLGHATLMMTGTDTVDAWVSISVPAGTKHTLSESNTDAPRIMQQEVEDTDFEIEVKFESPVSSEYQMEGVLIEEEPDNRFLRFDFHSDGSDTRIYAGSFYSPTLEEKINHVITGTDVAPLYMRVKREGAQWTQSYSYDSVSWTPIISFTESLTVTAVGVFVGNSGSSPPAHTGDIDYFFNTALPIDPEDGEVAEDTTPPLIHNVQEVVGQTRFRVSWSTDEPATGTVQYGETTGYELGSVNHTDFTLHHTLLITDLEAATPYNFQIVSEDSSGYSSSSDNFVVTTDPSGPSPNPVIDVWYGPHQVFGHIGIPQQWVNILGNVSDPEGVASLTYSLNSGPESSLSIGPDGLRLVSDGDFNVEIANTEILSGSNQVAITATDHLDNTTVETVTVEYSDGNVWPLPYTIGWSSVATITDVAQIVDGLWTLEGDSIRPATPGYDRLVAIGDVTWDDYQVIVPITIHSTLSPDTGGVGIVTRWQGHFATGPDEQPTTGWWQMGAYGYHRYRTSSSGCPSPPDCNHLLLRLDQADPASNKNYDVQLDFGTRYIYKMRAETTTAGQGGLYKLKVWEDGQPEPHEWHLVAQDNSLDLANGSVLLVAHDADASFGDVSIVPLADITSTLTVTKVGSGTVNVDPNQSDYTYGQVVTLTAIADPGSVFTSWSGDLSGPVNPITLTMTDNRVVTATFTQSSADEATIVSDDFNACSLAPELWTFENPLGDATQMMTGTNTVDAWVSISVPAGTKHTLSGSNTDAPRIMQQVEDTDFEIEVKFESPVSSEYQMQGILIEEEKDNRFLRFDFHSDGSDTRIYAGSFYSPTLEEKVNQVITGTDVAPLYMRVKRERAQWTQSYSYDNVSWTPIISFTESLTVTAVGVFVGNSGSSPPAHTGYIDYFFNTASPIDPEDGELLTINVVGNGQVLKDPPDYSCGQVVTLTATADPGWSFNGWSGDLSGSDNPETLTMDSHKVVTATFTQGEYTLTVSTIGSGSVAKDPDQTAYTYAQVVTLTATADPGWSFNGWSGDLSGSDNPETLTMDSHKVVTATFTQDEYTLTVDTVGNGSVAKDPDQTAYTYAQVVTLTATADPGWSFEGWSGDLSGSDNLESITMYNSRTVTATFTLGQYRIFLPLITVQYST